jgi:hypothetical protein
MMLFPIDLIGQLGFFRTIFDYAYYVRRPDSLAHCTEPVLRKFNCWCKAIIPDPGIPFSQTIAP